MGVKILGLQFREDAGSMAQERACIQREAGIYTEIDFVNVTDKLTNWGAPQDVMSGYSGLIIGGSSDFYFDGGKPNDDHARKATRGFLDQLRPLFQYLFDNDVPTLGICFGHQLLGAFAGVQVTCDSSQKKTCSHPVKLMVNKHDYFLFSDLPDEFFAHYGHKDALDRVPEGAVLLMNGGDECKVSALRYKKNIYTTQFHPELNYVDMIERMNSISGYLPEGVVAEEIFKDEPHSNTILQNFGKFVCLHQESLFK